MKLAGTTWQLPDLAARPRAQGRLTTDITIIGGGMAGLLTAYLLRRAGKDVFVVEAEKILSGVTLYTTAFLTQVIDTDASDLIAMHGLAQAKKIWQSHGEAIDLIEKIIKDEGIECEFSRCSNYIYARTEKEIETLKEEQEALNRLGAVTVLKRNDELGINCPAYLEIKHQAKFHPLKFLTAIAQRFEESGGIIFEKSKVQEISGRKHIIVSGRNFRIKTNRVITATYQPFDNPFAVFLKKGMYLSYILEIRIQKNLIKEGTYEDLDNPYHYFRVDRDGKHDRMIIGGEDHRKEIKLSSRKAFASLEKYLKETLGIKKYTEVRRWSSLILEPSDGLALIGEYKPSKFVATAFSGNGMTYSGISALMFRDLLSGKKNPWTPLYDPRRLPTLTQLAYKGRDYGQELVQGVSRIVTA